MKEEFISFVRSNPSLIKYVRNNEMTWQKFYELYKLYGKDNSVWDEYLGKKNIESTTINDVVNWFKKVDLDNLKEGIGNIERVIGVVKDFSKKDNIITDTYKPRPLYKHFED